MIKRISKNIAVVLALVMLMTGFAFAQSVDAASKADMSKANIRWDLKNNKTLKFKTKWSVLGVKTHTVKMTGYKVKNAKKKGYKQCTFTLTVKRSIKPTKAQVNDMYWIYNEQMMEGKTSTNGPFGGGFYWTVVDYRTGKSLEINNSKNVKVTSSGWEYKDYQEYFSKDGFSIRYPKTSTVKVKIVYPEKYKNLAVGFGGFTDAPRWVTKTSGTGASGYLKTFDLSKFWEGKKNFSAEKMLSSKKDNNYAHFMRVK